MLKFFAVTLAAAAIGIGWSLAVADPAVSAAVDDCCAPTTPVLADAPTTRPAGAYPLAVCPVSGEKLGSMGDPVEKKIDGRTVKFCCAGCVEAFEKDSEKWNKKMDELIVEAGKGAYPLDECVVSGEELGSMGEPINLVHRPTNTLVRLCCRGCLKAYEKEPKQYVDKIKAAQAEKDAAAEENDR